MADNEKIFTVKIDIPISLEVGAHSEEDACYAVEQMIKILTMSEGRGESISDVKEIKYLREAMATAQVTSVKLASY